MTEETDAKKTEALFNLQVAEKRANLINEAQGQFKFKWRWRDYVSGLWLLVVFFGINPFPNHSNDPNYYRYIDIGILFLFVAFQLHRISRIEHRADAIIKLLLKD